MVGTSSPQPFQGDQTMRKTGHNPSLPEKEIPKDLLGVFVASLPHPFLILDSSDVVLHANPKSCALLGVNPRGQALVSTIRAPVVSEALKTVRETRSPLSIDYMRRVPTSRHFKITLSPLGEQGHLALFLEDFSQAHRLERTHSDFIAYASHELKTPLCAILGFVETLEQAPKHDPDLSKRFLSLIAEQGRRMQRLIEDLLALSKIDLDRGCRRPQAVDLKTVAEEAKNLLEKEAERVGLEIILDLKDNIEISGVFDEYIRLFCNLFENGLKYASDGKRLVVTAEPLPSVRGDFGPMVCVRVQDFGPGIAPEHLPRLTERFYRIPSEGNTGKGTQSGTGLGLSIVENLMERNGGKMSIRSLLGKGTCFELLLPSPRGSDLF